MIWRYKIYMKKVTCIISIALLCLCLAACGETGSGSETFAQEQTATQAETAAPTSSAPMLDGKSFDSVEDFLNEPSMAAYVAEAEESFDNDDMSARIYGEGDTMIYEFTYKVKLTDDQIAQLASALNDSISASAEAFSEDLENLRQYVSADEPKVLIVYLAGDGTEITSRLFK